ncbi:MAG TPA: hypothetical protein VH458_07060 [Vicinamibacterales bacterium]|jgi:hypothetical protein
MSFSALAALIAGGALSIGADPTKSAVDFAQAASGFDALFLHDNCIGDYPPQPDTCLHEQLIEKSFTFGGSRDVIHDVRLRIRGIFEPTTIVGGETPYPDHPYFKIGGTVGAREWSAWHIQVSSPKQTYWLNHYPTVSHTIYAEDFEATIPVAGEAAVVVRVIDGNDRQIDNNKPGPDRLRIIKEISTTPLAGQMLRLDVIHVAEASRR